MPSGFASLLERELALAARVWVLSGRARFEELEDLVFYGVKVLQLLLLRLSGLGFSSSHWRKWKKMGEVEEESDGT